MMSPRSTVDASPSPAGSLPAGAAPPDSWAAERDLAIRILTAEHQAVEGVIAHLGASFHHAVTLLEGCARAGGTILVTGLGKSGIIGQKISAMLASLGAVSHFVHPAEAAHGDLGRFRKADVCLALSYSGETDEVVSLAEILRQDGVPIIAITRGTGNSSLEQVASANLAVGTLAAESSLSPAPSLSTTALLALGDALAICLAARLGETNEAFNKRHPGGALGALYRPVIDALRFTVGRNLNPVPDDLSVGDALRLAETSVRRPGALLLIDRASGRLTGLFTDADLRRHLLDDPTVTTKPIRGLMTAGPRTLPHTALLRDAVHMVRQSRNDEIPVIDDLGRPVGILDVQDLVALRLVKE